MHEYSIVDALIARVAAEARARQATAVHRVLVRIGDLSGVEVDLLKTAYAAFRADTICANADLDICAVPARWACAKCRGPIAPGAMLQCDRCRAPAELVEGGEIWLDRIEMEVT